MCQICIYHAACSVVAVVLSAWLAVRRAAGDRWLLIELLLLGAAYLNFERSINLH